LPFRAKDLRGWQEFGDQLAEHPGVGSANTLRGVQKGRPNLYLLRHELGALAVPLLVMTGDEDEPCLEPSLYLKRIAPTAGLVVPKTGHTINLEEPALFNSIVDDFLASVAAGQWAPRDLQSLAAPQLGHR
jgi:pimeloyl-ACP methyl ester carboxylesterase